MLAPWAMNTTRPKSDASADEASRSARARPPSRRRAAWKAASGTRAGNSPLPSRAKLAAGSAANAAESTSAASQLSAGRSTGVGRQGPRGPRSHHAKVRAAHAMAAMDIGAMVHGSARARSTKPTPAAMRSGGVAIVPRSTGSSRDRTVSSQPHPGARRSLGEVRSAGEARFMNAAGTLTECPRGVQPGRWRPRPGRCARRALPCPGAPGAGALRR